MPPLPRRAVMGRVGAGAGAGASGSLSKGQCKMRVQMDDCDHSCKLNGAVTAALYLLVTTLTADVFSWAGGREEEEEGLLTVNNESQKGDLVQRLTR